MDFDELVVRFNAGTWRPRTDCDWTIADPEDGWSIAHIAASAGKLPNGFDQWGIKDGRGRTVAHVLAESQIMPKSFKNWGLKDGAGNTVAHVAASCGHLPDDKHWAKEVMSLVNNDGVSVAEVYATYGHSQLKKLKEIVST